MLQTKPTRVIAVRNWKMPTINCVLLMFASPKMAERIVPMPGSTRFRIAQTYAQMLLNLGTSDTNYHAR